MLDTGDKQAKKTVSEPTAERMRVDLETGKKAPEKQPEKSESERTPKPPELIGGAGGNTAQKIRDIVSDDNNLEHIIRASSDGFKHSLESEAKKRVKDFEILNAEQQEKIKHNLIKEEVLNELHAGQFGPLSRAAYAVYVLVKNDQITDAAKQLVGRKLDFPAHCPIVVPKDRAGYHNSDQVRQGIVNDELRAQLPAYFSDDEKLGSMDKRRTPSADEIKQLDKAEQWLKEAQEKLKPLQVQNAVKLVEDQLKLLLTNQFPEGWAAGKNLTDKQAQDYLDRALPWLTAIQQSHAAADTLLNFNRLSKEFGSKRFASLLRSFPGHIDWDDRTKQIDFKLPQTLDEKQSSRELRRQYADWTNATIEPLQQAFKEFTSALDSELFATTNGELLPDGEKALGINIKGELIAAGADKSEATQENVLSAQVRLSKEHVIQVRAMPGGSTDIKITDSNGKLRAVTGSDSWVNVMPGDKCSIAGNEIDLQYRAGANRLCYWATLPTEGKKYEGQEYNQVEFRYQAKAVDITLPDGRTEQRIKVTTSAQRQYKLPISYPELGLGVYDIGKPMTSGQASINGETLPDNELPLNINAAGRLASEDGAYSAQVRLSKDGLIQVQASSGNSAQVKITDSSGQSHKLDKPGLWVNVLPGSRLSVGGRQLYMQNDTRFYKPEEVVAIKGSTGAQLIAAQDLPFQAQMARSSEVLDKSVTTMIDAGFLIGGLAHARVAYVAWRQGGKILAERAVAGLAAAEARQAASGAADLAERQIAATIAALSEADTGISFERAMIGEISRQQQALVAKKEAFTALRSSIKQLVFSGTAPIQEPHIKAGRGAIMSTDIFFGSTVGTLPGVRGVAAWWNKIGGHVDAKTVAKYLGAKSPVALTNALKEKTLLGADFYFVQLVGRELRQDTGAFQRIVSDADRKEQEKLRAATSWLADCHWDHPEGQSAQLILSRLNDVDKQIVEIQVQTRLDEAKTKTTNPETLVQELSARFLDKRAENIDKLSSALALLKLKERTDGTLPDVFSEYLADDNSVRRVTRTDIGQFLQNYSRQLKDVASESVSEKFAQYLDKISTKISSSNRDLLVAETAATLKLPDDEAKREQQVQNLVGVFNDSASTQADKLAAGLGLLFLGSDPNTGAIKPTLGERSGWAINVEFKGLEPSIEKADEDPLNRKTETHIVYEKDLAKATQQAFEDVKEFAYWKRVSPDCAPESIKQTVTAADALRYIQQQMASTSPSSSHAGALTGAPTKYAYSPSARLAFADLLSDLGQMLPEEHGNVCLEIFNDRNLSAADQLSAFFDGKKDRIVQFLEYCQEAGKPELADQTIRQIVNNQNQDRNLRTYALALLEVNKIENKEERGKGLEALQQKWQKSSSTFSDFYTNSLWQRLVSGKSKSVPNDGKATNGNLAQEQREESFQLAISLAELNEAAVIDLTADQRQVVLDTLLKTASVLDSRRGPADIKAVLGQLQTTDSTQAVAAIQKLSPDLFRAAQAISKLSNQIDDLSKTSRLGQLRKQIINILQFDDPDYNGLSTGLKLNSLANLDKIFAQANNSDRTALTDALQYAIGRVESAPAAAQQAPELSRELVRSLSQLAQAYSKDEDNNANSIRKDATSSFLNLAAAKANSLDMRLSALHGLNALRTFDGQEARDISALCSKILKDETDPALRAEAEGLKALVAVKASDASNELYIAREELKDSGKQINVEEARAFLNARLFAGLNGLESATGQRLESSEAGLPNQHLFMLEKGIGMVGDGIKAVVSAPGDLAGKVIFGSPAPEQQASVAAEQARKEQVQNEQQNALNREKNLQPLYSVVEELTYEIARNGDNADVARNALYVLVSDGYPVIPSFRKEAQEYGAQMWKSLCQKSSAEVREKMAPLTAMLMTHAPMMPDAARQDISSSLLSFAPWVEGNRTADKPLFTGPEVASYLSTAWMQAIRRMPRNAADEKYASNQKLQRALASGLSLYQTKDQMTLLAAIADDKIQSPLRKDATGLPEKYDDRSVERKNGEVVAFTLPDQSKWVREGDKFYREDDLTTKKHPWNCRADLFPDGSLVIIDKPNPSLIRQRNSFSLLPAEKEEAFVDRQSPGGTLTTQYGSQTTFQADGSKTVQVPFPAGNGDKSQMSHLWEQTTESNGHVRSRIYDRAATGWVERMPQLFAGTNKTAIPAIPQHLRSAENKSLTLQAEASPSTSADLSDHPMSDVRDQARSMLARFTEETNILRPTVKADPKSALENLQKTTIALKDKLKNAANTPLSLAEQEQVCKAIFAAGLSTRIETEADPRRTLLREVMSSGDERARLSAAHMLFEQSSFLPDRQVAAVELAALAREGSLLGYRQDAQRTIDAERKIMGLSTDPTIRFAFSSAADFGLMTQELRAANSSLLPALRELQTNLHQSIRFNAAQLLLGSEDPSDRTNSIRTICEIAAGARDLGTRDRARDFIREVQDIGFIDHAGYKQALLDTFSRTPQKLLQAGAASPACADITQHSEFDKESYRAVKLALANSKENYMAQFHENLLKGKPEYNRLDREIMDADIQAKAKEKLGMGWLFFFQKDFASASEESKIELRQQVAQLKIDAMKEVWDENVAGEARWAQDALAYVALTDRGDLGWESTKHIAEIIRSNGPGADRLAKIVLNEFLGEPSVPAREQGIVFDALKEHSRKIKSAEFESSLVTAAVHGLKTQIQTMPREQANFDFISSTDMQVNYLQFLQEARYQFNVATVRALRDSSPSQRVRLAADQLLGLAEEKRVVTKNPVTNLGFPDLSLGH